MSLSFFITLFLKPIKNLNLLTDKEYYTLFSNFEDIYTKNNQFLLELELEFVKNKTNPSVGRVISNNANNFIICKLIFF
jgi:hypothetical protein